MNHLCSRAPWISVLHAAQLNSAPVGFWRTVASPKSLVSTKTANGMRLGALVALAQLPTLLGGAATVPAAFKSKGTAMEIKRSGSRPSAKGPAEYFTGAVRIDPLFEAPEPARVRGASVTFEPGARTAWHPPARPDLDRDLRRRLGAALGRAGAGNPARRCGVV